MASALPHAKAGRLNLLAVGGGSRSSLVPDTPTLSETWPGFEVVTWYSIVAPGKTPRALVMRLNGEIARALANADTIARLTPQDTRLHRVHPKRCSNTHATKFRKFEKLIKAAGVRLDG